VSCFNQDLDPAREIEWLSFFPDVAGVTSPIPDAVRQMTTRAAQAMQRLAADLKLSDGRSSDWISRVAEPVPL
jgi:hypothetical protein